MIYRDVLYRAWGLAVELDGRIGHESARDRSSDRVRDLEAAAAGLLTVRVGWHEAELASCTTAATIAQILRQRGWSGEVRRCERCGPVGVVRGAVC